MNIKEILEKINSIEYGWVDKDGVKHNRLDPALFNKIYMLQTPKQLIKSKVGVCWDQVELQRFYFSKLNLLFHSYAILYNDNNNMPNHTFLVYEESSKFYWFEHAWDKYKGIHEFNDLKSLLIEVKNHFINDELKNICNDNLLYIFEYTRPNNHSGCTEFYNHFMNGENITYIIKE